MDGSMMRAGTVYEAMLPGMQNYGGIKVIEAPSDLGLMGTGDGRSWSFFFQHINNNHNGEYFTITQEIVDASMGTEAGGSTHIPGTFTHNRLVLPPEYSYLISDNSDYGCGDKCCGLGYRIWYVMKTGCEPEVLWVRSQPPLGENPQGETYGAIYDGEGNITGYAVWIVRGMGKQPKRGATTFEPGDYGTPNIICPGDEIHIGPLISVDERGCFYCQPSSKKTYPLEEAKNYTQLMTGEAICISSKEFYSITYHQQPNRLDTQWQTALRKINQQISKTLEFGEQIAGVGKNLVNSLHPGVGQEAGATVDRTTDGWFTLLNKYVENKIQVPIREDDCDNPCVLPMLEEVIGVQLQAMDRPLMVIGDDFLVHLINKQIANRYSNNIDNLEEAMKYQRFVMNNTNVWDLEQSFKGLYDEKLLPVGQNTALKYSPLMIGGKTIPFFRHLDIKKMYPGRIYLIDPTALEIRLPPRIPYSSNGMSNFFTNEPSAFPGTIIPHFHYDQESYKPTQFLNGQQHMMSSNNCPIKINWHLEAGANYRADAYPYTFIIDFYGIMSNGDIVSVKDSTNISFFISTEEKRVKIIIIFTFFFNWN